MKKMGYPTGLVRYTTEKSLEGEKTKIIRPRIVVYGVLLVFLFLGVVIGIATRSPVSVDVIRDRNSLYRETNNKMVENVYTLKIINKGLNHTYFSVSAIGLEKAEVLQEDRYISVSKGEVRSTVIRVRADPDTLKKRVSEFIFVVESDDLRYRLSKSARFIGPSDL